MGDIVKPKIDIGFKKLFATPENGDLLKSMVASLIGIDVDSIESIQLLNNELLPDSVEDKFGRTDLVMSMKMKLHTDKIVNVEIQIKYQSNFTERSLFYWSRIFASELAAGETYDKLPETVCINIVNFRMFKCNDVHSHFQILEKDRHELLSNKFGIHFYELPKLMDGDVEQDDLMTLWLKLIDSDSEEDLKVLEKAKEPNINQAVGYIRHMSADARTRELARLEEKRLHDEASIIKTARDEGEKEGRVEGRAAGRVLDVQNIVEALNISEDEALKILKITKQEYEEYKSKIRG